MEDPANCASAKQKSAAFEWLRKVAIGQSEDAEHAAVMMYEVVNLRAALEPFADIRAANIDALPDSAGFAARSNGRHVTYGDIRAAREVLLSNVAGNRLARQGQSELTGVLGVGSEAKGQTEC